MMDSVAIGLLTSISIGGIGLVIFNRKINRETVFKARLGTIADVIALERDMTAAENALNRKKAVERGLKELEEKQNVAKRKGYQQRLIQRMREAGIPWSIRIYLEICATVACCAAVVLILAGMSTASGLLLGAICGWIAPQIYISKARKKRLSEFERLLPNAVDVVSRGLQAGLPLGECIKIVSTQAEEPVRSEFVFLVQDLTLGLPMEEAANRFAQRVPLNEVNFFATIVGSQSKIGGSLSESLTNLSTVLRDRRNMKEKVKTASSEVVTSSVIIGVMPILVGGLVYWANPDYMGVLFNTVAGQIALTLSAIWMLIGIFVIRKMVNMDI